MPTSPLFLSILIAVLGFGNVMLVACGGFMRGFVNDNPTGVMNAIPWLLMAFAVVYALWTSSRIVMVIGGVLMLPVFVIGLFLIVTPVGIPLIALCSWWYYEIYQNWQHRAKASQSAVKSYKKRA